MIIRHIQHMRYYSKKKNIPKVNLQISDSIKSTLFLRLSEYHNHCSNNLTESYNKISDQTNKSILEYYYKDLDKNLLYRSEPVVNYIKDCVSKVTMRNSILFCIDVEAYERSQNVITEIGISIFDPTLQKNSIIPNIKSFHIIIKEHKSKKNGEFVADNKKNFLGDHSLIMSNKDAILFAKLLVDFYFNTRNSILVGHELNGDIKWFNKMGINFPNDVNIIDTRKLWIQSQTDKYSSLTKLLNQFELPSSYLHNAGNDSYYTLLLCLKLCDPFTRSFYHLDEKFFEPKLRYNNCGNKKHKKMPSFSAKVDLDVMEAFDLIYPVYEELEDFTNISIDNGNEI